MRIKVTIRGVSPLLQHRFPDADQIETKSRKRAGSRQEEDIEKSLYRLPDGVIYQPSEHILGAMIRSASNFLIVGKRKKSYKELVKAVLFIEPECIVHKKQKWGVDQRIVRIPPGTGAMVLRSRPRFENWELDFTITTSEEQMAFETIKEILDYAGRIVGIGDHRPRFGRFTVTRFEEENSK